MVPSRPQRWSEGTLFAVRLIKHNFNVTFEFLIEKVKMWSGPFWQVGWGRSRAFLGGLSGGWITMVTMLIMTL